MPKGRGEKSGRDLSSLARTASFSTLLLLSRTHNSRNKNCEFGGKGGDVLRRISSAGLGSSRSEITAWTDEAFFMLGKNISCSRFWTLNLPKLISWSGSICVEPAQDCQLLFSKLLQGFFSSAAKPRPWICRNCCCCWWWWWCWDYFQFWVFRKSIF